MEVEFKKEDLHKLVYWIICKFNEDKFHHQSASAKSDLIGGFFDRWFNRAPEFLIFRELLKDKKYDVIIDNFLYGQDTKKNAPDIIGLKDCDGKILTKFSVFNNGNWEQIDKNPQIEVKTFREKQSLSTVGETQMKNENYYVFVESKVRHDYLITLFKENIFEKKIFDSLFGYKEFIKSDSNNQIIPLKEIKINDTLGFFKLLGIFKGDIVQKYSILVGVDENNKPIKPRYFGEVKSIEPIKHKIDEKFVDIIYRKGLDYVPFFMKPAKKSTITIVKKLKGYMIVKIAGKANLNGEIVDQGYFKIIFKKFDRSSRKKEFIGDKKVFEIIAKNSTNELINKFDNLV